MSAEHVYRLGSLARSVRRDPEDPAAYPAGSLVVRELLGQWRAAERAIAELDPGSEAWLLLKAEIEVLRLRYHEAYKAMTNPDGTESPA